MKIRPILLTALLLGACNGSVEPVDSQKFLGGLDGPKVPTIADALTESAQNAEKNGDFKQASQIYQQIAEKHPDDKDIQLALADSYRRGGEIDKALQVYDLIIIKTPDMVAAKEGKGLALIAKSDFDTPVKLLEDVLQADPKRWKTLNALGILFTTRNLHTEAQQYFAEALKYHPDSPTVLNNMGLSQALNHQFDEAIATLNKASSLSASGSLERKRVDLNMALVCAAAGKLDDAKAIAEQYLTGAALNNNLGMYAHLAKDDQMSKAYLNMALTESKVFYEKAWDNLQDVSGSSASSDKRPIKHKVKVSGTKPPPPPVMPTFPTDPKPDTNTAPSNESPAKMPQDLLPANPVTPSE